MLFGIITSKFFKELDHLIVFFLLFFRKSKSWASLVAQLVKNLPALWETWVWSLGWEDPLEKGTATLSSILAWRIPWTAQSMGMQRVGHDWATFTFTERVWMFYTFIKSLISIVNSLELDVLEFSTKNILYKKLYYL